jgi:signal transduction histidine kinase
METLEHELDVARALTTPAAVRTLEITRATGVVGSWDRKRMDQVLAALLSNAARFGPGRPIVVQVAAAGPSAVLSVRDFGIGIPKPDQQRIFERFERAVSIRHYGGLGTGLYLAREIVAAHEGSIRVESDEGAGSTFVVELPLQGSAPSSASFSGPG